MVNGSEGGNVRDQIVQEVVIELRGGISDQGLLSKHHSLGCLGVGREETPVDESTISQIYSHKKVSIKIKIIGFIIEMHTWVVALLGSQVEDGLDHALGVGGSLQEKLDNGSEQLQLHLSVLVLEVLEERGQQLCK